MYRDMTPPGECNKSDTDVIKKLELPVNMIAKKPEENLSFSAPSFIRAGMSCVLNSLPTSFPNVVEMEQNSSAGRGKVNTQSNRLRSNTRESFFNTNPKKEHLSKNEEKDKKPFHTPREKMGLTRNGDSYHQALLSTTFSPF
jgi:hypothetical protein